MTQEQRKTKYWVIVASKDHVQNGINGGFAQACHGKSAPLKRMRKNDLVIYYSGKQTMGGPEQCQEFTAIGTVKDDAVYPFQMSAGFCPSRRNIGFMPADAVSILPLISELDFILNKKSWGYPFRFGFFEISQHDYELIAARMLAKNYAEEHQLSF